VWLPLESLAVHRLSQGHAAAKWWWRLQYFSSGPGCCHPPGQGARRVVSTSLPVSKRREGGCLFVSLQLVCMSPAWLGRGCGISAAAAPARATRRSSESHPPSPAGMSGTCARTRQRQVRRQRLPRPAAPISSRNMQGKVDASHHQHPAARRPARMVAGATSSSDDGGLHGRRHLAPP
jgi:hypothetical protein